MNIFIIAEIGINHGGELETAKKLIDMASLCGCDAVKFQKRAVEEVYKKTDTYDPQRIRETHFGDVPDIEWRNLLEFGEKEYDEIDKYCKENKRLDWFASAWDLKSLEFLRKYNLQYNKIASPMITNLGFLEAIAGEKKHTFISTGMTDIGGIDEAVRIFRKYGCPFTLLHAVSVYPCPDDFSNLNMIKRLKSFYDCPVGYSGHTPGIQSFQMAVEHGAEALEFHITLDRASYGSDQASSMEIEGVMRLVKWCRTRDGIMGDGIKRVLPEEERNAEKLRYFEEKVGKAKGV